MAAYDPDLQRMVEELNRGAAGSKQEAARSAASLDGLLGLAVRRGASDVLIVAGAPVVFRINGELSAESGPALSGDDARKLIEPMLDASGLERVRRSKALDFSFTREAIGRFRVNVHHQRGTLAAAIRVLPARVPTLEALHLPPILGRLAARKQGLILVTGPTGSGKTSTLAALIDAINGRSRAHVVTIEEPIEYQHLNRAAIIEQIDIGHDSPGFAAALRSVLRRTPDVILVGEMRDPETMAAALTAAETGHLVLSSLHTNDASQAVARILDSFPTVQQGQIRHQLSLALAAVVAQRLVPAARGPGRYPALEILIATDAVRNLIRKGEDHQLRSQMSVGRSEGMMTLEQSMGNLARSGEITLETAFAHSPRPDDLRGYLAGG